jgi:hypothetical protein
MKNGNIVHFPKVSKYLSSQTTQCNASQKVGEVQILGDIELLDLTKTPFILSFKAKDESSIGFQL